MNLEQDDLQHPIEKRLAQTRRLANKFIEMLDLLESQTSLYEGIVEEIKAGLLPDSFTLDEFDKLLHEQIEEKTARPKPDDMRFTAFKGKKLAEVVLSIFDKANMEKRDISMCISIDELAKLIYTAKTKEEINACKSSLTAVLNRCVNSKELIRIKPGVFTRNTEKRDQEILVFYREEGAAMPRNGKALVQLN